MSWFKRQAANPYEQLLKEYCQLYEKIYRTWSASLPIRQHFFAMPMKQITGF